MANETSKAEARRRAEGVYRLFEGRGIDIGCGQDPVMPAPDCIAWDKHMGDGALLPGIEANSQDFIYSSHMLEDLDTPFHAISRWWEVIKPGGILFVVVPDEDLYEQRQWPPCFNTEHRRTYTAHKTIGASWSPVSTNLTDLLGYTPNHQLMWIRTVDAGYDYSGGVWDRTLRSPAEAHIELCVKKL